MNRNISLFLVLLSLIGCAKKQHVTEAEILGAWENVMTTKPFIRGLPFRNRVMFYKTDKMLVMGEYTNWQSAKINTGGDTIILRQGCIVDIAPLMIHKGRNAQEDTLIIGKYRKFTRMDNSTYISGKKTFLERIHYKKPYD